jgi:hypothetical protein
MRVLDHQQLHRHRPPPPARTGRVWSTACRCLAIIADARVQDAHLRFVRIMLQYVLVARHSAVSTPPEAAVWHSDDTIISTSPDSVTLNSKDTPTALIKGSKVRVLTRGSMCRVDTSIDVQERDKVRACVHSEPRRLEPEASP